METVATSEPVPLGLVIPLHLMICWFAYVMVNTTAGLWFALSASTVVPLAASLAAGAGLVYMSSAMFVMSDSPYHPTVGILLLAAHVVLLVYSTTVEYPPGVNLAITLWNARRHKAEDRKWRRRLRVAQSEWRRVVSQYYADTELPKEGDVYEVTADVTLARLFLKPCPRGGFPDENHCGEILNRGTLWYVRFAPCFVKETQRLMCVEGFWALRGIRIDNCESNTIDTATENYALGENRGVEIDLEKLALHFRRRPDKHRESVEWSDCCLRGLVDLDVSTAEVIAKELRRNWVDLSDVQTLTPEAAQALSGFTGLELRLNGLASLSAECARFLRQARCSLSLNGLVSLSGEQAAALAASTPTADLPPGDLRRFLRPTLYLNGLKTLSSDAARALAAFEGQVDLFGLEQLSAEAHLALKTSTNYRGFDLSYVKIM